VICLFPASLPGGSIMRRILAVVLAAVGLIALAFVGAPSASAAGANYVALGDSYASGLGAGSESGDCDRSPNAYSALWAASNTPASYVSVACAGATTADVAANQVPALTSATTLVSLTVGGNDENFGAIMEGCNLSSDNTCVSDIQAAENDARATLPGKLASLYGQIAAAAPFAEVVVLGYARFYDLARDCFGLSQTKRAKIDEDIDLLDSITATAAAAAGFTFADVRAAFASHEICDNSRWLHSVNFFDIDESYHPTVDGQSQAYLPTFSAVA
jgi:lysophospholipase L1-like esterase